MADSKKIIFVLAAVFLFGIVFSRFVFALGITPGRTTIDFSSKLEREVEFSIINSESKNMGVAFSVQGELAEFIRVDSDIEKFSSNDASRQFKFNINLSSGLSPGLHKAEIIATELPEDIGDADMMVRATVSVVTQIYVYVPYPGKYIESDLNIVNKEDTNVVSFYIPMTSRGKEDIGKASAVIEIYKGESKIISLNTNEKGIKSGERAELIASWNPDVAPGEYNAVVNLIYDNQTARLERKFNVGNESLAVVGISTNEFKLGQIAKIKILVQNKLSDPVHEANVNMRIYDPELTSIADLKSENYELAPLANTEMVTYWDTEKIEKGEYSSELKINFDKKFISKGFKVRVNADSIDFTGVGFAVSSQPSKAISTRTILFIVIGVLVLINVSWLVYWMRNRKSSGKKEERKSSGKGYLKLK
ncbi:MAG: hypothetical protein KKE50_06615 [Nanoarchaeota archaeon]|nr:hypothetical protein [Nanoarchaeota archaeon]